MKSLLGFGAPSLVKFIITFFLFQDNLLPKKPKMKRPSGLTRILTNQLKFMSQGYQMENPKLGARKSLQNTCLNVEWLILMLEPTNQKWNCTEIVKATLKVCSGHSAFWISTSWPTKGQKISKAIFLETPMPKKETKFFEGFLP